MDELREYLAASATERLELRVRRKIGQGQVTVRLCVGRRNGKTELLRRAEELMEPGEVRVGCPPWISSPPDRDEGCRDCSGPGHQ